MRHFFGIVFYKTRFQVFSHASIIAISKIDAAEDVNVFMRFL